MSDGGAVLPWLVIREDGNGNRYRVGSYATRVEAEKAAARLHRSGGEQLYVVERVARGS
ncbi:SPOR domain-containing protein [Streptomyces sp. S07_1.15]|uniref:SPOR domain-containing protein n=1 Tax=Streptomyces sp. S07_1.15 TaxID=2873925 RepID=UPI001D140E0D|nr:SPOR domain-containing protein [Streptomyces sp. S07_1.15]MCC3651915.1 SPOR domain-containing protein [Streptomyces sp. S07_1.15]